MADGNGHVLQIVLTRGNRNEVPVLGPLLAATVSRHGRRPRKLAADKGYSADRIRWGLLGLGIEPVIPMRENEHVQDRETFGVFDKQAYRRRNVVERCVGWLKESRALATRFEKLAMNFAGTVRLAMILRYLRILDPSDKA